MEAKWRKDQYKPIYFTEDNFGDINQAHDDPMVILVLIHNFLVKQILVDQGSSVDILYSHTAKALDLQKSIYNAYTSTLVGVIRGQVQVDNTVRLQLTVSTQSCIKMVEIDFLIISTHNSTYNTILGRPSLNKIGAIISTPHLLMKFPTNRGIGQVRADQ